MSLVKSDLIKELANNYPNFLRKDLMKLVDIILYEMQNSLKRGERVELRDIFTLDPKIQKEGIRRNPKTGEKVLGCIDSCPSFTIGRKGKKDCCNF